MGPIISVSVTDVSFFFFKVLDRKKCFLKKVRSLLWSVEMKLKTPEYSVKNQYTP